MTDYDPATCVTAAELRAAGHAIPAEVPDCAWVPRDSLRPSIGHARVEGGVAYATVSVTFTAPFTWLETTVEVKP